MAYGSLILISNLIFLPKIINQKRPTGLLVFFDFMVSNRLGGR